MLYIDFDSATAFNKTLDWLEKSEGTLDGKLVIAVGQFYSKLDELVDKINDYFE